MLHYVRISIVLLLQEEKEKLREAIVQNDTDLIQHMFKGNNIDVNADISGVRSYILLISTVYVHSYVSSYIYALWWLETTYVHMYTQCFISYLHYELEVMITIMYVSHLHAYKIFARLLLQLQLW